MKTYQGSCHCGFVTFEVDADIQHVRVCDCSICHKRGALLFRVPNDALHLITPLDQMTLYKWGSETAEDYFCPNCGILPFRRPSVPTVKELNTDSKMFYGWAINTRCLDDFDTQSVPIDQIVRADVPIEEVIASAKINPVDEGRKPKGCMSERR